MTALTFDEQSHTYEIDGERAISVTKALVESGLVDTKWFTELGRDRGSATHAAIHLYEQGGLDEDTIDDRVRPFFDAYLKFKAEYEWQPEATEVQVWSKIHGYAGTLDSVGKSKGRLAIADFKTGALHPVVGIQLTGYALGYAESQHRVVTKLLGVRLVGDGSYRIQQYKFEPAVFYSMLNIARWKGQ